MHKQIMADAAIPQNINERGHRRGIPTSGLWTTALAIFVAFGDFRRFALALFASNYHPQVELDS
jgi:hypothetical protein